MSGHAVLQAGFTITGVVAMRTTEATRSSALPWSAWGWVREIMGLFYVIHNRRLLSMLDSFRRNAPLRRQQK